MKYTWRPFPHKSDRTTIQRELIRHLKKQPGQDSAKAWVRDNVRFECFEPEYTVPVISELFDYDGSPIAFPEQEPDERLEGFRSEGFAVTNYAKRMSKDQEAAPAVKR